QSIKCHGATTQSEIEAPARARDMLNGHQRKSSIEYVSRFGLMKIASLLSFAMRHISQAEGESARLCRATKALVQNRVGIDSVQSWRCGKHLAASELPRIFRVLPAGITP